MHGTGLPRVGTWKLDTHSLGTFVVNARRNRNRTADARVNFFWSVPDLVELWARIRSPGLAVSRGCSGPGDRSP